MPPKFAVVDLFAGPGGLSEGFSQVRDHRQEPVFDIALSVEKEASAHKTLTLRSAVHRLDPDDRSLYIKALNQEKPPADWSTVFGDLWAVAQDTALQLELGIEEAREIVDKRIDEIQRIYHGNTVLIGGPPCQAYSLVGRARNLGNPEYRAADDGRHYLYREYIRILDRLRPAVFVMENVKGILSSRVDGTPIFPLILEDLRRLAREDGGYTLVTLTGSSQRNLLGEPHPSDFIVRAEDRGVPQARHRVIVVGIRDDIALPPGIHENGLLPPFEQESATVAAVLSDMPSLRSGLSRGEDSLARWRSVVTESAEFLLADPEISEEQKIVTELRLVLQSFQNGEAPSSRECGLLNQYCPMPPHLAEWIRVPDLDSIPNNTTRAHIESDLTRYIFAAAYARVHDKSPKAVDFPSDLAPQHRNWRSGKFNDRFRVQLWDKPSSTVTSHISKDGHYYIHPDPTQARSLTVREAARLQTFPDDYLFLGNRTQQYVQVGNAVPAFLAFQIGNAVARILSRS